jgi:hypothetical protein
MTKRTRGAQRKARGLSTSPRAREGTSDGDGPISVHRHVPAGRSLADELIRERRRPIRGPAALTSLAVPL